MKITNGVLRALGARLLDEKERIWQINSYYKLKWARRNTLGGDPFDVWEFGYDPEKPNIGHFVTDVEEMVSFAYRDGLVDGRNSLRHDLKELLRNE